MSVFKNVGPRGWCVAIAAASLAVLAACHSEKTPNWQYEGHGHVKITISLEGEIYELENGFRSASKRNDMINVGGFVGASWVSPLYKVLDDGRVILVVHDFGVPSWTEEIDDYHVVCRNETCDDPRIPPRSIGIAVLDDAVQPEAIQPYLLRGFGDEAEAFGGNIELLEVEVAAVREDTRKWPAAEVPWLAGAEELVRRGEAQGGSIAYASDEEERRLREKLEAQHCASRFEGQAFCLNALHLVGPKGWRPYARLEVPDLFRYASQIDRQHITGYTEDPIEPILPTRTGFDWIDHELNDGDHYMVVSVTDEGAITPFDSTFTKQACTLQRPPLKEIDFGAYRLEPNNPNVRVYAMADDASIFAHYEWYSLGPESFYDFGRNVSQFVAFFQQAFTRDEP